MSHLPECLLSEGKFDGLCICDRLRACEQRVLKDLVPNLCLSQSQPFFDRALTAAREAVVSMVIDTVGNSAAEHLRNKAVVSQTLAAIDALRVKP